MSTSFCSRQRDEAKKRNEDIRTRMANLKHDDWRSNFKEKAENNS